MGIKLCKQHNIDTQLVDSIVLIKNDSVYIKSSALLKILKDMPKGWRFLRIGIMLPKGFRDWMYDMVAKHRYKIFGKKDECPIPSVDIQDRFL